MLRYAPPVFTGIIEIAAEVKSLDDGKLVLHRPAAFTDVRIGSSIAVSGACLTVVELGGDAMTFDVVPETLGHTTLGELQAGDSVNLERALPADGRFEGHILQGHVEATAVVTSLQEEEKQTLLTIGLSLDLLPFVVEKGSIALDGVSLTVAHLEGSQCTVAIIPHTLAETTLGSLQELERVNVETDILGRYVASFLSSR